MVGDLVDSMLTVTTSAATSTHFVLDLYNFEAGCDDSRIVLEKVVARLKRDNASVVGIINFAGNQQSLAGLPVFSSSATTLATSTVEVAETVPIPEESSATTPNLGAPRAKVHYGTVRSGQQVYAEKASLIIIGGVNDGGEVLADGDIHVYGPLKGRAVAGLGGGADGANACVFARSFGPSLVGVNEVFIAPDDHGELIPFLDREVVVRASGARNFSTGVGVGLQCVEIDGVTVSL